MSLLVIGATGLVGSKFVSDASGKAQVIPADENHIDVTNVNSINNFFLDNDFDSVINFAAITDVDAAEKERENKSGLVWKLNGEGAHNLAEACKKFDKFLVHISTDFVFPGTVDNPGPYSEDSPLPNQLMFGLGWYGWSKNRAEEFITLSQAKHAIVRISYPFYADTFENKFDFAKNYLNLFDQGKLYPLFNDQVFTPLLVDELAEPLLRIIQLRASGVYHIVSSNTTTPFEFTKYLLKKARGVENVVQESSMQDFLKSGGKTPRPRLGGLRTEITQKKLGLKFKTWQEMVDEFTDQYQKSP